MLLRQSPGGLLQGVKRDRARDEKKLQLRATLWEKAPG